MKPISDARTCKDGRTYLQGSSFHAMISSFYGMISSFHAVFGLRQRDKSAKVIDYNDQVIGVWEYLLLLGNPFLSPMFFLLSRKKMGSATFVVERLSRVCQGMTNPRR